MMNIWCYAVLSGFIWSIVAEVSVQAQCQVEPEADMDCIPNYSNCSHSTRPCCREKYLRAGSDVYAEFVCFRFGESICEPLSNIRNVVKYAQLVKNMNGTNFFERLRLFEQNLKVEISGPEYDYFSYVIIGSCGAVLIFLWASSIIIICYGLRIPVRRQTL